jgi:chromosome segregation ATPase
MEWFDSISNILSLLFGGSVISIFTWKIARRKANAEATQAEIEAAKAKQDYYQQMMEDLSKDRDYWKHSYEEMRDIIRKYDERIAELEQNVTSLLEASPQDAPAHTLPPHYMPERY